MPVLHTSRRVRTVFRKIPTKSRFWLITDTLASSAPRLKFDNTGYMSGWNTNGTAAITAVTPGTQVIRTPPGFLGQNHVNA